MEGEIRIERGKMKRHTSGFKTHATFSHLAACYYLQISPEELASLCRRQKIRHTHLKGSKTHLFQKEDLDEYMTAPEAARYYRSALA
jgi:hypothetical protein